MVVHINVTLAPAQLKLAKNDKHLTNSLPKMEKSYA
jgi:hypothetical protein